MHTRCIQYNGKDLTLQHAPDTRSNREQVTGAAAACNVCQAVLARLQLDSVHSGTQDELWFQLQIHLDCTRCSRCLGV